VLLVICSNRGLCGGYNGSILREAIIKFRKIREDGAVCRLELSGKRAISYFRFQRIEADETFIHFEDKPRFDQVEEVADKYLKMFLSGEIDRVEVASMRFISAARQSVAVQTLLPLGVMPQKSEAGAASVSVEYEFAPSAQAILDDLLPASFKQRLFKCFLDAAVSEQIARRVTMKAATENADGIIKTISRQYNRARQAQITKEIAEVIGGAAALE
jgi:F-type H+-transporting ATPase subunit gamma